MQLALEQGLEPWTLRLTGRTGELKNRDSYSRSAADQGRFSAAVSAGLLYDAGW